MPFDLSVILETQMRGMDAWATMAGAVANARVQADLAGRSMDDLGAKQEKASGTARLLSSATVDVGARMTEARARVDEMKTSLIAHGLSAEQATTATKGLIDQFARKSVFSDFKSVMDDAGVSTRGLGSAMRIMANNMVADADNASAHVGGLHGVFNAVGSGISAVIGAIPLLGTGLRSAVTWLDNLGTSASNAGEGATAAAADTASLGPAGIAAAVGIVAVTLALAGLIGSLAILAISFAAALTIFTGVLGVFGLLGAGIVALGVAMGQGSSNAAALAAAHQSLSSAQASVLTSTSSLATAQATAATDLTKYGANSLQYANAVRAVAAAEDRLTVAHDQVTTAQTKLTAAQQAGSSAPTAAATAWSQLTGDLQAMAQTLAQLSVGPATTIITWLDSMIPKVQAMGEQITRWFGQALPQMMPIATNAIDALFKAMNGLGPVFTQVFNYVIDHRAEFEKLFNEVVSMAVPAVQGLVANLEILAAWWFKNWPAMQPVVSELFSILGTLIQGALSGFETLSAGFQKMDDVILVVANQIGAAFDSLGTSISSGLGQVIGVIDQFISVIQSSPIGQFINLQQIPNPFQGQNANPASTSGNSVRALGAGGIVTSPTAALIGEAGPEAVIPLGGGGQSMELLGQAASALGVHGLGANMTPGTWGGQCVVFVEAVTGTHYPVAFAAQMASFVNTQTPAPGEVFVSTIPPFGHTGIVLSGGEVIDSNWGLNEMIQIHPLSQVPDIVGYISGTGLSGLPSGATVDVTSAMSTLPGIASRALGGLGGWEGKLADGLMQMAIKGIGAKFDSGGTLGTGLSLALNDTGRGESVLGSRAEALLELAVQELRLIRGAPSIGGLAAAQRVG